MNLLSKEHRLFLYFITFVAFIRLLLAPFVGLGVDEAHYVLYGINLDLSYFDHPPLVGWVQYVFTSIFGSGEFGSRVAAITIGFVTSVFIYKLIYDINKKANEAFIAVLALHASFMFNALFLMLMPDTLLFLLVLPIIFTVIQIEKHYSSSTSDVLPRNLLPTWILLGVLLGLAGLSKYTAVLFVVPIVLYFIIKKRYEPFYAPQIIPAVLIALAIISPVIIWNMQNDWISFTYQSNHVVGAQSIKLSALFSSLAAQFGAYNPFLFPFAFYGLYKSLRSGDSTIFLTALFGLVLISFFTYASLYKVALPHWSALFYMLFIPLGAYYALYTTPKVIKFLKFAIGFGLLLSALIYTELGFKYIPLPDYGSLHRDIYGWDTIMKKANSHIKDAQKEAIGVSQWTLASRAIYYDLAYDSSVYLIDDRFDQFDFWQKSSPIGKDLVMINTHFFHENISTYMKCDAVNKLESFDIMLNSKKVNTVELIECKNYQGLK